MLLSKLASIIKPKNVLLSTIRVHLLETLLAIGVMTICMLLIAIPILVILIIVPYGDKLLLSGALVLVAILLVSHVKYKRNYINFLKRNEGAEFFCYANRKNSQQFVEKHILPFLESHVNVIRLEGKKPISQYDEKFISHTLYKIKQIGFPNVMKFRDGRVIDMSLHNELYNTINQKKRPDIFLAALNEKLNKLRTQ